MYSTELKITAEVSTGLMPRYMDMYPENMSLVCQPRAEIKSNEVNHPIHLVISTSDNIALMLTSPFLADAYPEAARRT